MPRFWRGLEIPHATLEHIEEILAKGEPVYGKGQVLRTWTVKFLSGNEMDIKVVDSAGNGGPWTEGVLFREDGVEVCHTDVGEDLAGEYICFDGDDEYTVTVREAK